MSPNGVCFIPWEEDKWVRAHQLLPCAWFRARVPGRNITPAEAWVSLFAEKVASWHGVPVEEDVNAEGRVKPSWEMWQSK